MTEMRWRPYGGSVSWSAVVAAAARHGGVTISWWYTSNIHTHYQATTPPQDVTTTQEGEIYNNLPDTGTEGDHTRVKVTLEGRGGHTCRVNRWLLRLLFRYHQYDASPLLWETSSLWNNTSMITWELSVTCTLQITHWNTQISTSKGNTRPHSSTRDSCLAGNWRVLVFLRQGWVPPSPRGII